jgi:hypothetical protein
MPACFNQTNKNYPSREKEQKVKAFKDMTSVDIYSRHNLPKSG